jgi:hypothetical protein
MSTMMPNAPDASPTRCFKDYRFHCKDNGSGEIYDRDNDKPRWLFNTSRQHKSLLSFTDSSGQTLLTIQQERGFPLTRFLMLENDSMICTICQRSMMLNRYSLDYSNGPKWTFYLPLFSIFYKGEANSGDEVRVRMVRHDTWKVRISDEADNYHLVAGLALIHRERQRFS